MCGAWQCEDVESEKEKNNRMNWTFLNKIAFFSLSLSLHWFQIYVYSLEFHESDHYNPYLRISISRYAKIEYIDHSCVLNIYSFSEIWFDIPLLSVLRYLYYIWRKENSSTIEHIHNNRTHNRVQIIFLRKSKFVRYPISLPQYIDLEIKLTII